jgi:hypothetical protein
MPMAVGGLSLQMDFGDDDVDRPNHYQLLARRPCEGQLSVPMYK